MPIPHLRYLFATVFWGSCLCCLNGRASELLSSTNLPVLTGLDSGEPNLARGPDNTLYLTWSGPGVHAGERALYLAKLAPAATAWSQPTVIVSSPLLMENWADFASLIVGTDGALTAQWFQSPAKEDSHGYTGWFARSTDGGTTWTAAAPLGEEFVSLAPLSGGRTLAVWLESAKLHDAHAPRIKPDTHAAPLPKASTLSHAPSMRLRARLLSAHGSTEQDWLVDPDVCSCCQTSLAVLPGDRAIVTYRGHTADEIRDHCVSLFTGAGWTPPRPLHHDEWKIAACPVNGPAADTRGEHTAIAWFTAAQGVARMQAKLSVDGGLTFGPALPLDLGRPIGRLDLVMLADGSAIISWLEARTEKNSAGLYVRRLFPDGSLSAARLLTATSSIRASGFARLAARSANNLSVVISWTETNPAPNAKTPAPTSVHTAEFLATALPRERATVLTSPVNRARTVVSSDSSKLPELCAVPASAH